MLIALVANLALSLAAGADRIGFPIPAPRRVLICQFELPVPQFVSRLALMRRALGAAADQNLLVDTRAAGHLLSAAPGLNHFVSAARAAAAQPPRLLQLDPRTLWFSSAGPPPAAPAPRRKVDQADVQQALADMGDQARYNQLRDQIMNTTECSKRTAQLAISEACQRGVIVQANGQYRLPL